DRDNKDKRAMSPAPRMTPSPRRPRAMSTQRQRESARINGSKSKGPTSLAGILISMRNSMKHGFSGGRIVLPENLQAEVEERAASYCPHLEPDAAFEIDMLYEIAHNATLAEQCGQAIHARVDELALTARDPDRWAAERRRLAERLAARLEKQPGRVKTQLEDS